MGFHAWIFQIHLLLPRSGLLPCHTRCMKSKTLLALLATLGTVHAQWKPVEGRIMTKWAKEVTPENAWDEYPRPLLEREKWTSLNGLWDYQITEKASEKPASWGGKILVPFAPESALSGVGKLVNPDQALWYHRTFTAKKTAGKRQILHFEGVDYRATVFVNGKEVGGHLGSSTPFCFDVTEFLKDGDNELVVRAYDSNDEYQPTGKQRLEASGIFYTRVTGIWQTVWIEEMNERSIKDLDFTADIEKGVIGIKAKLSGAAVEGEKLRVKATLKGAVAGSAKGSGDLSLTVENPQLWSPDTPNVYDLQVELLDGTGKVIDSVKSYTALRSVGKVKDKDGNWRFTLNGKSIFHWGPLDQGWWPDGLLTPPSDEAMVYDIAYLKDAGFNMIRKHIKVEPRRYYMHCDRIGMMIWQDQVSAGKSPAWTRMEPNPKDIAFPEAAAEQWIIEYKAMVDHLRDQPSIVIWTPYNEAWGQHDTMANGRMAVAYDPTRLINIASGGNFWPVGDVADQHAYPDPAFPLGDKRFDDYVKVVGEFGGHGWAVKDHLWDPTKGNWGYGGLPKTLDEWKGRYEQSINVLRRLRYRGISAGVYTQTTDVEGEINGLLTYDRLEKVPASWLKPIHDRLLKAADSSTVNVLTPTSESETVEWKFTTEKPADGWESADFDAQSWTSGKGGFGTSMTPGAKIGTEWNKPEIWVRREFEVAAKPKGDLVLRIFHDEDAVVYLNGTEIANLRDHSTRYLLVELDQKAAEALKVGKNVLAIHVKQTRGGQFIDAGLTDEVENR